MTHGGPHAGDYAYQFLVTAPRGKMLMRALAYNPTSPNNDRSETRTFVTKFRGRRFQVLRRIVGPDTAHTYYEGAPYFKRPFFRAHLCLLSVPSIKWRATLLLQARLGSRWRTQ